MPLPFFYKEDISTADQSVVLNEEGSKHIIQVLRMRVGEQLQLTDGKGNLFTAEIADDNRKRCEVKIQSAAGSGQPAKRTAVAISLIKNTSRFEWFLEKATEIGVSEIIPLICERTEKQHFRHDRMKAVLVSAMLQSQQTWLPVLHEATKFAEVIAGKNYQSKYIAHCLDENNKQQLHLLPITTGTKSPNLQIILIGPEGDFTPAEIESAISNQFIPVALGETRLRTETAGVVAATLLQLL